MVQSTTEELEQLINQELEKNVTLEAVDPAEVYDDSNREQDFGDDNTTDPHERTDVEGSLSDEDRGEAVQHDYDDDDVVNTSSQGPRDPNEEDYNPLVNAVSEDSFRDDLKQQIDMLEISSEQRYLAHYIIDCLDEDGYLRRPLVELVDDLEFTQHHTTTEEDLEEVLVETVQEELDPSGIGARDLRECLLLQLLDRKATPATQLAYEIVNHCFDDFMNKRYDRIEQSFGITNHSLFVDALRTIRHLNPKPGNMQPATQRSSEARMQQVRPDFIVRCEEGQLVVSLCDEHLPVVRISADQQSFFENLQQKVEEHESAVKPAEEETSVSKANNVELQQAREGVRFLKERIQSGQNFIDALNQRRTTLIEVMTAIVDMQRPFFLTGQIETLHPMTLQNVADRCHYDISTISRVSKSKYVDTEFGILSIKDLFTNEVADSNQSAVIAALRQIIEDEDKSHPLSDDALAQLLAAQNYEIARRTVAKYREILGYPVARLRKEL